MTHRGFKSRPLRSQRQRQETADRLSVSQKPSQVMIRASRMLALFRSPYLLRLTTNHRPAALRNRARPAERRECSVLVRSPRAFARLLDRPFSSVLLDSARPAAPPPRRPAAPPPRGKI